MALDASLTLKWDCGLRQIQKEVQKYQILVMMALSIRNLMLMTKTLFNYSFEHLFYGHDPIKRPKTKRPRYLFENKFQNRF
jgi:hypothetical protein